MPNTNTLYRCAKGYEVSARFSIIVEDNGLTLDLLPYGGDFCFVCFAAWVAQNVPRAFAVERPVEISDAT